MKTKKDLLFIATTSVLISAMSIGLYISKMGLGKIDQQGVRFAFTILLAYFLYQEKQWARWVMSVLFMIAGLMNGYIIVISGFVYEAFPLYIITAFHILSAIYLMFIRKWKNHEQKNKQTV